VHRGSAPAHPASPTAESGRRWSSTGAGRGEIAPLAACCEDIEDGVRDFAQGVVSGKSACFGLVAVEGAFENGLEDCPLVVGQVCLVGLACDGLYSR